MLAAVACFVLASAPLDAGDAPRVVSVRHALLVGDDGRTYSVDGGVWLSTEQSILVAKERESGRAVQEALRAEPPPVKPQPPSRTSEILGAFTAGVASVLSVLGLVKKL